MQTPDFIAKERKAATTATTALRSAYRSKVKSIFKRRSGEMEKSTFSARYRDGSLDRLVLTTPHYAFKKHYGSTLSGSTAATERSATSVKAFVRKIKGQEVAIKSHIRGTSNVRAHVKGINYKSTNHIAEALKASNALPRLATELGENRIIQIASLIDFE